jgi:hypothetical protein
MYKPSMGYVLLWVEAICKLEEACISKDAITTLSLIRQWIIKSISQKVGYLVKRPVIKTMMQTL